MATVQSKHKSSFPEHDRALEAARTDGFDVTCTIGRVVFVECGEESAHVAAFKLIAQHDTPGTFRFPLEDGGDCVVDVSYENVPPRRRPELA